MQRSLPGHPIPRDEYPASEPPYLNLSMEILNPGKAVESMYQWRYKYKGSSMTGMHVLLIGQSPGLIGHTS